MSALPIYAPKLTAQIQKSDIETHNPHPTMCVWMPQGWDALMLLKA